MAEQPHVEDRSGAPRPAHPDAGAWDGFYERHGDLAAASRRRGPAPQDCDGTATEVVATLEGVTGRPLAGRLAVEIGCGSGRMTARLARAFGRVVAVDVSEVALERCRQRLGDRTDVTLWHGGAELLAGLPSRSADWVVAVATLQHVSRKEEVLSYVAESSRLLAAGGVAALEFATASWRRRRRDAVVDLSRLLAQRGRLAAVHPELGLPAFDPHWRGARPGESELLSAASGEGLTTRVCRGELQSWLVLERLPAGARSR